MDVAPIIVNTAMTVGLAGWVVFRICQAVIKGRLDRAPLVPMKE